MGDRTMFMVIGVCLSAYIAVVLVQAGYKIYDWLKHRKAREQIHDFVIPPDYSEVEYQQKRINKIDESGSIAKRTAEDSNRVAVQRIRMHTARIREAGFIAAGLDQRRGVKFDDGVKGSPYPKGSGEAKQWVRGYCMGYNVMDIAKYYEEA